MAVSSRKTRCDRIKREDIIKAATDEFLLNGYQKTSITEIVKKVGGSTRNIYSYFNDKHGLLLAVLEYVTQKSLKNIFDIDPVNWEPRAYLVHFAKTYLNNVLDPRTVGFYRLVMSESLPFPEVPRIILRNAQQHNMMQITHFLESQIGKGRRIACDTRFASEMFFSIVRDKYLTRAAMDPALRESASELDDFVEKAVDLFLRGIGLGELASTAPQTLPAT